MNIKDTLQTLSNASGTANNYSEVFESLKTLLPCGDFKQDKNGNIFIHVVKNENAKIRVLLDAHIDEIGFVVNYITDDGFLKISKVGGIDKRLILSSSIKVMGKQNIIGIISSTAPHLQTAKDEYIEVEDCFVDLGMTKEKVKETVNLGDYCTFCTKSFALLNDQITGKAMDNRAGCTALLSIIYKLLKSSIANIDICAVFSIKEECAGSVGASTFSFNYNPTNAIVIDTSFALDSGAKPYESGVMEKGAMIGISPILDKDMTNSIIKISKDKNINFQKEVLNNSTGTNADNIANSGEGVKTSLISIPIKNMHSPVEIVSLKDINSSVEIVLHYLEELDNA